MSRHDIARAVTVADVKLFASILPVFISLIYFGVNLQRGQEDIEKNQRVTNLKIELYGDAIQKLNEREVRIETIIDGAQERGEITAKSNPELPGLTFDNKSAINLSQLTAYK